MTKPGYCDEALDAAGIKPTDAKTANDERMIATLAKLGKLAYLQKRKDAAKELGVPVADLDKLVREAHGQSQGDHNELPHWKVEPWTSEVAGAELLDDIKAAFTKYIVLPPGAGDALALWTLHAWTMDAGDISPFLVLVSPTKRCGKTSVLIVLLYLTPKSELASNISSAALFRYIEDERPTLLIDEADSFVRDNEEMRGVLNSGHTKAAAYVIRSVEVNGEHKARRFSTWAPKAIATIRSLADTLEDRAIIVQLQRKPKAAKVERLRKRDGDEFVELRRRAARWAKDSFAKLTDPDPTIPQVLNDRAADNWRPLLAVADLAGGRWPNRAREAACVLSGEGHDTPSMNVQLLADIRQAFGDDDAIRSIDLVAELIKDPERPWVEWKRDKPLTQKQLGGLLSDFQIISETVRIPNLADAKGYKRIRFEEAWAAYLPGQNTSPRPNPPSEASKRRNADDAGTSRDFRSVRDGRADGSKSDDLPHGHTGYDASTLQNPPSGAEGRSATNTEPSDDLADLAAEAPPIAVTVPTERMIPTRKAAAAEPSTRHAAVETPQAEPADDLPDFLRRCQQCNAPSDARGAVTAHAIGGGLVWLHDACVRFYRRPANGFRPPQNEGLGRPALGPDDDDLGDFK